jgi:Trehalose utilisation
MNLSNPVPRRRIRAIRNSLVAALAFAFGCRSSAEVEPAPPSDPRWLTYPGGEGFGQGKHIVLIAADQEYRSEEALPMLARILSQRHGFHCTVLFALNADGLVDPTAKTRYEDKTVVHDIPGLELLAGADLVVLFSRLITLPDAQIQRIIDYIDAGKPLIAIRTANHGFLENFPYRLDGKPVRFGEDVLGGTFLGHHGNWHQDSTRGLIVPEQREHPILRGVEDIWGQSDVYRTYPEGGALPAGCTALVYGQPLLGRNHGDAPNPEKEALPVAWTKTWTGSTGKTGRIFHQTMGSARDFQSAGLRRLTINAVYWCVGLEAQVGEAGCDVELVGPYAPRDSGFDYAELDVSPRPVAAFR